MLQGSRAEESNAVLPAPPEDLTVARQLTGALLRVETISRSELERCQHWSSAFSGDRKDHRYYELVEDTIHQGFDYRYFALKDERGEARAVQPFFINDQDLLAGSSPRIMRMVSTVRRVWPRFLKMRTMMIGCAAGEGHLDAEEAASRSLVVRSLASGIFGEAPPLGTKLIVFKEFTAADRGALSCLLESGFARLPSMPMTRLRLNFGSFDDYLRNVVNRNTRSKLRRKFKESERRASLEMRVVTDVTPYIDEVYACYMAVYDRSRLRFEKLTREYLCELGSRMPDKVLFFLWFLDGKVVAFNLCMTSGTSICSEYIGFDYKVAFELHLYYVAVRDVMKWAIANGYQWYRSTALNYEPKSRLQHELEPLDLYVKHTSPAINFILKRALPYLEPTRYDKLLQRFSNYSDLHAKT